MIGGKAIPLVITGGSIGFYMYWYVISNITILVSHMDQPESTTRQFFFIHQITCNVYCITLHRMYNDFYEILNTFIQYPVPSLGKISTICVAHIVSNIKV
jgi:hypothetical protein